MLWRGGVRHPVGVRRLQARLDSDPPIPVRRFGIVPPPPQGEWEIEPADPDAPRTIAEYGGTAVLLAGVLAAAVAGWVLFLG